MSNFKKLMMAGAGGGVAWDISYAFYSPSIVGDITTMAGQTARSVNAQESQVNGVFVKPDGTKMYISGVGDEINEYNLTFPFSLTSVSFVQVKSVSSVSGNTSDLFFKPDGTKVFFTDWGDKAVYEWDLSTAWDISTASASTSLDLSGKVPGGFFIGLTFKSDGTKMYITETSNDSVHEYNLSTAWDVSSGVFSQSKDVSSNTDQPHGISFLGDGTKMYIVSDSAPDSIDEWSLSTAWDISTASFTQEAAEFVPDNRVRGMSITGDGSFAYFAGNDTDTIYGYVLGGFVPSGQVSNFYDLFFKPDGTKMYLVGTENSSPSEYHVFEYALSTAFELSTASFTYEFNLSGQVTLGHGLFFKSDGTVMYVLCRGTDAVYQYSLGTAWDTTTATYASKSVSILAQDGSPRGIFFKPDGTKMYHVGSDNDNAYEYDLSTAWDVSTATFSQSFSVSGQEPTPTDIFFKPDGKKMYVGGLAGDDLNEYDLSTAWDISTAVFLQSALAKYPTSSPAGSYFSDDGTILFRGNGNVVYRFKIEEQ